MIKFFRKIRQEMLTKNKIGKYLFYAFGEIVLVVIGILIALSINNWNENQKKEKLKVSYRNSLMNDLSLDTLMLNELIDENYNALKTLNNQKNRFLGSDTPKIARFEFDPNLNTNFQYNRNTLNTLIASGNINLFSKEFNEMLMTLISLQDTEREKSKYFSEVYSSKISRFSDDYPVSNHENSNIINLIWTDINERKLASSFISLTDIKGFAQHSFIKEIENVKEKTTILLKQLNNQN